MTRRVSSLSLLSAFLFCALTAPAQTFRGGINGTVTDSTGAAIAGASVKASNAATGLTREAITSGTGEYAFQDLPLGEYQVTAAHPGFELKRVESIAVEVSRIVTITIRLGVATQAATVEVAASNVNIETASSPWAPSSPPKPSRISLSTGAISPS